MKKTKHSNKRKAYLGAAGALLSATGVQAQAEWIDISPDVAVIDSFYNVDFNSDGIVDIYFTQVYFTNGNVAAQVYAQQGHTSNRVAASQGANGYLYPILLDSGNVIGAGRTDWKDFTQNTNHGNYMSLVFKFTGTTGAVLGNFNDKSGFVGVEFKDASQAVHYGWVEMTVDTLGTQINLKAYGYQPTVGAEVKADENQPVTTGIYTSYAENLSVLVAPNPIGQGEPISLKIESAKEENATICLYDMNGRLCYSEKRRLHTGNQVQFLEAPALPSGIYSLTVLTDTGLISKKVNIL